jgi:ABC-type multidrug transport system ATPase subunit
VITSLGLTGCKDIYVGDDVIRGVSGGQKKRVTAGEMLVCPRPVKIMDSITNGLDAATAFDIVRTFRLMSRLLGMTILCSLLQPPPEVYDLFDEVMILSEGQIIFHGKAYGFSCNAYVDMIFSLSL